MRYIKLCGLILVITISLSNIAAKPDSELHKEVLIDSGYNFKENLQGHQIFSKDHGFEREVVHFLTEEHVLKSPEKIAQLQQRVQGFSKQQTDEMILTCTKGDRSNFYKFLSVNVGSVGQSGDLEEIQLTQFADDCFHDVQVMYTRISNSSYSITFYPGKRQGDSDCKEVYQVATSAEFHEVILDKQYTMVVKDLTLEKILAIESFGIYIFRMCDDLSNVFEDFVMTVLLYLGGFGQNPDIPFFGSKPTWWQEILNPDFIQNANTYDWKKRKNEFVDLSETEVHSGDFLIVTRMDGLDQLIQWGAGSISGHSVTLLEFDGEMWAVESQDGWYWPKHGIQRNPWKQWKQWAQNAGFNVAVLPLRDDVRKKFDVDAAVKFFKSIEGMPYGYHNFLFGWLDVPKYNVPPLTTLEFLYVVLSMVERIYAPPIVQLVGEALNKRLDTHYLSLNQIAMEIHRRNMTLDHLFGIPEQDGWWYSDGYSYVCSAFVAGVYKAGGLFDPFTVQATEFSPRDVYQLNFFNTTGIRPQKCKDADPSLPYCQIMGSHLMDITNDGWSTVNPYENMNERCPTIPPKYERLEGC